MFESLIIKGVSIELPTSPAGAARGYFLSLLLDQEVVDAEDRRTEGWPFNVHNKFSASGGPQLCKSVRAWIELVR